MTDLFSKQISIEAVAGEIMEESREEGIAIGEERGIAIGEEQGARTMLLNTLPMLLQFRFGQALPNHALQRLQALDLTTLQTLQAFIATSSDMDAWIAQIK